MRRSPTTRWATGGVGAGVDSSQRDGRPVQHDRRPRHSGTAADDIDGIDRRASNNLIGSTRLGGLVNGVNGNQVGVTNPGLAPALANNGGPTQTIALLAGSPAINAGASSWRSTASRSPDPDHRPAPRRSAATPAA